MDTAIYCVYLEEEPDWIWEELEKEKRIYIRKFYGFCTDKNKTFLNKKYGLFFHYVKFGLFDLLCEEIGINNFLDLDLMFYDDYDMNISNIYNELDNFENFEKWINEWKEVIIENLINILNNFESYHNNYITNLIK